MKPIPVTRSIAEFITASEPSAINEADCEAVARAFMDTVGVMSAASVREVGTLVSDHLRAVGGSGLVTVLPSGFRTTAGRAAWANGTLAHAFEYDDYMAGSLGHASSPLVPALLAASEVVGELRGEDLVVAFAVGLDLARRLKLCARYDQADRGIHGTSVFGAFAATAGCARILGLSVDETVAALSIAVSEIGGLIGNFGSHTKAMQVGLCAEGAVTAALLARSGARAAEGAIEARMGWADAFLGPGNSRFELLNDALAEPFNLAQGLGIKIYPCCGRNHSAIEGLLDILATNEVTADGIAEVHVYDVHNTIPALRFMAPKDGEEAMFSLPYAVAVAIANGGVTPADFHTESLHREATMEAMRKVHIHTLSDWDPEFRHGDGQTNPVMVRSVDGRSWTSAIGRRQLLGSPATPISEPMLLAKFCANAAPVFGDSDAEHLGRAWRALRHAPSVGELIAQTTRASRPVAATR